MRVIEFEELAKLLHQTHFHPEDFKDAAGHSRKSWDEEAEFNRDDYREWAKRILELARVAIKPNKESDPNGNHG